MAPGVTRARRAQAAEQSLLSSMKLWPLWGFMVATVSGRHETVAADGSFATLLLILPYGASGAAGSLSPALEPDGEPGLRLRQTVVEVMTGSVEKVVVMVVMEVVVLVVISSCGSWLRPVDGYGDECCAQLISLSLPWEELSPGLGQHRQRRVTGVWRGEADPLAGSRRVWVSESIQSPAKHAAACRQRSGF
ncbi:unnamed protein product [Gadus morhua 'NCC']